MSRSPYQVALEGCDLEFVFVLPNTHDLVRDCFPLYENVVVHKDRGETRTEEVDKDIPNVSPAELVHYLEKMDSRKISWICIKPGMKNSRIYVFFSKTAKALEMNSDVESSVNKLVAMTYQWGKIYVLRNEIGNDLINIELYNPVNRAAKHFFDVVRGHVLAFEHARSRGEQRQPSAASK